MNKIILFFFIYLLFLPVVSAQLILTQNQYNDFSEIYSIDYYSVDRYSNYVTYSDNTTLNGEMYIFPDNVDTIESFQLSVTPSCNDLLETCNGSQASFVNRFFNVTVWSSSLPTPSSNSYCFLFGLFCEDPQIMTQIDSFNYVNSYPARTITFSLDVPYEYVDGQYIYVMVQPIYSNLSHNSYVQFAKFIDNNNLVTDTNISFSGLYESNIGTHWILGDSWSLQESHLVPSYKSYFKISFYGTLDYPDTPQPTPTGTPIVAPTGSPELPGDDTLPLPDGNTPGNFSIPDFNTSACGGTLDSNNTSCVPISKTYDVEFTGSEWGVALKSYGYCTTDGCGSKDIIDFLYDFSIYFCYLSFMVLVLKSWHIKDSR